MFVAASTECYRDLPLEEALSRFLDLEFTSVELAVHEEGGHLRPSDVLADFEKAVEVCQDTLRLNLIAFSVEIAAEGEAYYEQFAALCRLAKAVKVVTLTVPSAELGTPFNEEVERLRRLVDLATLQGVRVGMKSQRGRLTEDPDTVVVLCDNVKGLGLTLDPSHYLGPQARRMDRVIKYVYHVHLRDSKPDELQVRIGQGEIDYGKLINQLRAVGYDRALTVHMQELPGVDHMVELRKLRLLLESMLL